MLLGVAFTVLLLLISGVSAVLSPERVKLSCQNLNVSVSWQYSKQKPETIFRVHVGGSAGHLDSNTTEQRYDLSHFVWASEEHYLGFHHVTVTAEEGGNQSESILSETFTFNNFTPADISCNLHFPPVDLIENGSGATVSFVNPLLFYTELKEAPKSDLATFKFAVSSNNGDSEGACEANEICKLDISFPEGAEKCIKKMKGWLYEGSYVRYIVFRETGRLCASKSTGDSTDVHMLLLIILLVVLASVSSVIIIAICRVKAWTLWEPEPEPEPEPKPMPSSLQINYREGGLRYAPVPRTAISPITLADNKNCKNPSVSSGEEEDLQDSGCHSRQVIVEYTEGGLPEGYGRDEDSADDSEKTEIVSMDLEGAGASGYDSPHNHQVDMGNGDMVTCYQGELTVPHLISASLLGDLQNWLRW
ncbi:interferon gamma receptor 1 [Lycodopsis pacificus]